jgi:hypothetical protein
MRSSVRRIAIVSGAFAMAAPLLAAPSSAQAQPDREPRDARQVCGRGFYVVNDRGGIRGKAVRPISYGRRVYGHVYLLYNNRTHQNCVVTIKRAYRGQRTWTAASLAVRDGRSGTDRGNFRYYAGPVKLRAGGKCVKYRGWMRIHNNRYATGGRDQWGNCRR